MYRWDIQQDLKGGQSVYRMDFIEDIVPLGNVARVVKGLFGSYSNTERYKRFFVEAAILQLRNSRALS